MPWNYDDWHKIVNATQVDRDAEARQLQRLKIAHAETTAVDRHNLAQNIEGIEAWRDDPEIQEAAAEHVAKHGGTVPEYLDSVITRETEAVRKRFAHVQGGDFTLHLKDSAHLEAFKKGMEK